MVRNPHSSELLIIFTRYPVAGKSKTRLIPALGAEGAAALQRKMSEETFVLGGQIKAQRLVDVAVFSTGGQESQVEKWLPVGMAHHRQCLGDLGKRMEHAFNHGFMKAGMERVIVVGADCPFLTAEIMEKGFDWLKKKDLVLGPAKDGGCYLVGLRRQVSLLWQNVNWGTEHVLEQIVANAMALKLSHTLLEPLSDIDRPDDLLLYYQDAI